MQKEKTLGRLHRLRQMEEEISRLDLEVVVAERGRIFRHWQAAGADRVAGRSSFARSVEEGNAPDRQQSLVVIEQSRGREAHLAAMLASAERAVDQLRAAFLTRRTATLQAQTLLQEARAERTAEEARRVQQMLDDWFGHRSQSAAAAAVRAAKRGDGRGGESSEIKASKRSSRPAL